MGRPSHIVLGVHGHEGLPMAAIPEDEVFTVKEVAMLMKCTVAMVRALIHRGELEAFRLGRMWRVRREVLDEYMKRQSPAPDVPIC